MALPELARDVARLQRLKVDLRLAPTSLLNNGDHLHQFFGLVVADVDEWAGEG